MSCTAPEQGRVHHIGTFSKLEDQMCAFTTDFDRARAGYSPDRLDALVWALTDLLIQPMNGWGFYELQRQRAEEAIGRYKPLPEDPDHIPWAPGSVEYAQAMGEREERQRKAEEARIAQQQAEAAAA